MTELQSFTCLVRAGRGDPGHEETFLFNAQNTPMPKIGVAPFEEITDGTKTWIREKRDHCFLCRTELDFEAPGTTHRLCWFCERKEDDFFNQDTKWHFWTKK
jgi:hypothetical protein